MQSTVFLSDKLFTLQGSPVTISDRQCYVEEKRTAGSRGKFRKHYNVYLEYK